MLMIPILVAFVGFLILAPGAVWHRGYLSQRQLGLVALAGPVTNMVLALVFLLIIVATASFIQASAAFSFWWLLLFNGYYINAWLGLFKMIPVDPFDGGKIWRWNKVVFGVTAVVGVLIVFVLPDLLLPLI
jgi:Zn-dependent protease